jgi:ElaB/YqjD/DUF883 family membrane-anchored ribosome-binding protein
MGTTPDDIRTDIERTRAELAHDVDRLTDRTSPKRIAHRQTDKARRGLGRMRERVMGSAEDAKNTVGTTASDAGDAVREQAHKAADGIREAPQAIRSRTQGSPLAAGLIAFGAGLLTAGLLPATDAERRAGRQLRDSDQLDHLKQQAADVAGQIGEDIGQSAQQAVQSVKETATDAAQQVGDSAKQEGAKTADQAKA